MEPVKVKVDSKIIAGVQETTSNEQERDYEGAKIPLPWRQYFQNAILYPLANEVENAPAYGVYHDYENGTNGEYKVTVGTEVSTDKNVETGYEIVKLAKGEYIRFDAKGEMPMVVMELWQDIWKYFARNTDIKRSFQTDFEVYLGEDEVSIYIGIENK